MGWSLRRVLGWVVVKRERGPSSSGLSSLTWTCDVEKGPLWVSEADQFGVTPYLLEVSGVLSTQKVNVRTEGFLVRESTSMGVHQAGRVQTLLEHFRNGLIYASFTTTWARSEFEFFLGRRRRKDETLWGSESMVLPVWGTSLVLTRWSPLFLSPTTS